MKLSILIFFIFSTTSADLIGYNRLGNNIAYRRISNNKRIFSQQNYEKKYKSAIAKFLSLKK